MIFYLAACVRTKNEGKWNKEGKGVKVHLCSGSVCSLSPVDKYHINLSQYISEGINNTCGFYSFLLYSN